MSVRVRISNKTKLYVEKMSNKTGLTEGEIIELELFGKIIKKKG